MRESVFQGENPGDFATEGLSGIQFFEGSTSTTRNKGEYKIYLKILSTPKEYGFTNPPPVKYDRAYKFE